MDATDVGIFVDVDSLKKSADLFMADGGVTELRATCAGSGPLVGFYNNPESLWQDAAKLSRLLKVKGVYITLNPVDPELLSRRENRYDYGKSGESAKDSDIVSRRWLLVDCDPTRPANTNSTDAEKATAREVADNVRDYLCALGWSDPVLADSGNGWHLLYRIVAPANDDGLVKGCLDFLANLSTEAVKVDVTVGNASRIVRFYGTMNRKGWATADRPQRVSRIVDMPEQIRVTPRRLLEEMVGRSKPEITRDQAIGRAKKYVMHVDRSVQGNNGSKALLTAACRLIRDFGLTRDEALPLLHEYNTLRCDPAWPDNEIDRVLASAEKKAAEEPHRIGEKLQSSRQPVATKPVGGLSLASVESRTEIANSRRFLSEHGDKVRFCHAWKQWLYWDGTRWKVDSNGALIRLGKTVMDLLWREVPDTDASAKVISFVRSSCSDTGVKNMLNLAASEVPLSPDEMDSNPWLLNCPNGTLNLLSGQFREHRREDNITKLCPTNFDPEAQSYCWDRFLEGVFADEALIEFMQRFFGCCLTGSVSEQLMAVFHGGGSNGKSTLLSAIQAVMGSDYSTAAPESLLMARNFDSHPTENATLHGQRLVVAQETDRGRKLDEARVKRYTGGDRISARKMRENFWDFAPTHKLVLSTNHRPVITGNDDAIWRRIALVPFVQKFWNPDNGETGPDGLQQDKQLPDKLRAEAEGILAWMVRGCAAWRGSGMQIPDKVRAATRAYRHEQDVLGRFVEERCVVGEHLSVRLSELYRAISFWSEENGEDLLDKKATGQGLDSRGFPSKRGAKGVRYRLGIDLQRVTGDAGDASTSIATREKHLMNV